MNRESPAQNNSDADVVEGAAHPNDEGKAGDGDAAPFGRRAPRFAGGLTP